MYTVTVPPTAEQGSYKTNATSRADGRRSLREYDENEPYAHRLVKRRVKIEE